MAGELYRNTAPTGAPPSRARWKLSLFSVLAFGVGLVVGAGIVPTFVRWYQQRPRSIRTWETISVSARMSKAHLITRWRGSGIDYQIRISPAPHAEPTDVEDFTHDRMLNYGSLDINLDDASGFKLCTISIPESKIALDKDKNDTILGLSAESTSYDCSYREYNSAHTWKLSADNVTALYFYKLLVAGKLGKLISSLSLGQTSSRTVPTRVRRSGSRNRDVHSTDSLTGFDLLTGRLDTKSGRIFSVYESGERYTTLLWSPNDTLDAACGPSGDCVVVDTDKNQTVHAHLLK